MSDTALSFTMNKINEGNNVLDSVNLMCPHCHKIIEMFNNDLQFSISMHSKNVQTTAFKVSEGNDLHVPDSNMLGNSTEKISRSIYPSKLEFLYDFNDICSENNYKTDILDDQFDTRILNQGYTSGLRSIRVDEKPNQSVTENRSYLPWMEICKSNAKPNVIPKIKHLTEKYENYFNFVLSDSQIEWNPETTVQNYSAHLNGKLHLSSRENLNFNARKIYCAAETSGGDVCMTSQQSLLCTDNVSSTEIYNNTLPDIITRNMMYIIKNRNKYICTLCNIKIDVSPITQTNRKNFTLHFNGKLHKKNIAEFNCDKYYDEPCQSPVKFSREISNQSVMNNDNINLQLIEICKLNPLPDVIAQSIEFIVKYENRFKCSLCDSQIEVSSQPSVTVNNFLSHFKGKLHKGNRIRIHYDKAYQRDFTSATQLVRKSQNRSVKNRDKYCLRNELMKICKSNPLPDIITQNIKFIVKYKKHFKCTMCNSEIGISSDPNITIRSFSAHLNGAFHKKNKSNKKYKDKFNRHSNNVKQSCIGTISNQPLTKVNKHYEHLKKVCRSNPLPDIIIQNIKFLVSYRTHFKCTLCDYKIVVTSSPQHTLEHFSAHLNGKLHSKNNKKFNSFISVTKPHVRASIQSVVQRKKHDLILNELWKSSLSPDIITQNKNFMGGIKNKQLERILSDFQLQESPSLQITINNYSIH